VRAAVLLLRLPQRVTMKKSSKSSRLLLIGSIFETIAGTDADAQLGRRD
jgi:hypothetical protein